MSNLKKYCFNLISVANLKLNEFQVVFFVLGRGHESLIVLKLMSKLVQNCNTSSSVHINNKAILL